MEAFTKFFQGFLSSDEYPGFDNFACARVCEEFSKVTTSIAIHTQEKAIDCVPDFLIICSIHIVGGVAPTDEAEGCGT